ncbi:unnamed protein product [Caenorhabditis auriculariae]|uniref:Thioredoxin domain-containing protein n=1 Tax=Caenorhabditis auriculariae TaxID=2777116 RepID=A0A8S1HAF8_9PELO|nr:unnamed protein product [Caenorhabditis auriculariae]
MGGASKGAPKRAVPHFNLRRPLGMATIFETSDVNEFNKAVEKNPYEKMAEEFKQALFMRIDVDEADEIAAKFDVQVMPTFVILCDGERVQTVQGGAEDALREAIQKHVKGG